MDGQGDGGCIAFGQIVTILQKGIPKNIKIEYLQRGDQVLTSSGFSCCIGEIHGPEHHNVRVFHFESGITLKVTPDHLVLSDGRYLMAKDVTVGISIGKHIVKEINHERIQVCSPLTESGTLVVNGIPISCFSFSAHWLARLAFLPLSILSKCGLSFDVHEYTLGLYTLYFNLPPQIRSHLPVYI